LLHFSDISSKTVHPDHLWRINFNNYICFNNKHLTQAGNGKFTPEKVIRDIDFSDIKWSHMTLKAQLFGCNFLFEENELFVRVATRPCNALKKRGIISSVFNVNVLR